MCHQSIKPLVIGLNPLSRCTLSEVRVIILAMVGHNLESFAMVQVNLLCLPLELESQISLQLFSSISNPFTNTGTTTSTMRFVLMTIRTNAFVFKRNDLY